MAKASDVTDCRAFSIRSSIQFIIDSDKPVSYKDLERELGLNKNEISIVRREVNRLHENKNSKINYVNKLDDRFILFAKDDAPNNIQCAAEAALLNLNVPTETHEITRAHLVEFISQLMEKGKQND
jgi:DNA-dependent RNA polymerase auxiliary subunit epsilon